jgi:hypothetical protein
MINMCQGCQYLKTRHIPFMGEVSGCIHKQVKPIEYVNATLNGKCERRFN